jgi:hypothetical protein
MVELTLIKFRVGVSPEVEQPNIVVKLPNGRLVPHLASRNAN